MTGMTAIGARMPNWAWPRSRKAETTVLGRLARVIHWTLTGLAALCLVGGIINAITTAIDYPNQLREYEAAIAANAALDQKTTRVERNLDRMLAKGATSAEMEEYVSLEGFIPSSTVDAWESYRADAEGRAPKASKPTFTPDYEYAYEPDPDAAWAGILIGGALALAFWAMGRAFLYIFAGE